jgi:hypothetical protein
MGLLWFNRRQFHRCFRFSIWFFLSFTHSWIWADLHILHLRKLKTVIDQTTFLVSPSLTVSFHSHWFWFIRVVRECWLLMTMLCPSLLANLRIYLLTSYDSDISFPLSRFVDLSVGSLWLLFSSEPIHMVCLSIWKLLQNAWNTREQ